MPGVGKEKHTTQILKQTQANTHTLTRRREMFLHIHILSKVPVEYRIGKENMGFMYLVDVMNGERMYGIIGSAR